MELGASMAKIANSRKFTFVRSVVAIAACVLAWACTTTTITPEIVQKPTFKVDRVAVGEISIASQHQRWAYLIPHFRQGLVTELRKPENFAEVIDPTDKAEGNSTVLLVGQIMEVDEGSAAARILIGFGAGRARARGVFEIRDSKNVMLARFESGKAYSGGAGIGGFDMVSFPTLVSELGQETAKSIIRWSKGEQLQPSDN